MPRKESLSRPSFTAPSKQRPQTDVSLTRMANDAGAHSPHWFTWGKETEGLSVSLVAGNTPNALAKETIDARVGLVKRAAVSVDYGSFPEPSRSQFLWIL